MERCYLFANLGIYKAVEHIVAQENPGAGKHYFDLACAPDENKNQLFNVELIIDEDGTWAYGATVYSEKEYSIVSIAKVSDNGEYSLNYEIVSKETFKIMKENEKESFKVEDVISNW